MLYKKIDKIIIVVAVASILLGSVIIVTHNVNAIPKPFYTKPTKYMIFFIINPIDPDTGKSNDCYSDLYSRFTPKNANHDLLNKIEIERIVNNDAPDNGPSKKYTVKMFYDINTFHQSDDINEGKIRGYGFTVKVGSDEQNPTITKYLPLDQSKKVRYNGKTVFALDFQTFNLPTDPTECKSLIESRLSAS